MKIKNPLVKRFIKGFLRKIYPLDYLMLVKVSLKNLSVIIEGVKTFSERIFVGETKGYLPRINHLLRDLLTKIS